MALVQDFSKQGHRVDIKTLFPDMITDFRSVFLKKKRQKWTIFLLKTPWDNNSVPMSTAVAVTQKGKQTSENLF